MKFLIIFLAFSLLNAEKCPQKFLPPKKCFEKSEILEYAKTVMELESYYTKFLELLTQSDLVIDEREVSF